jgi:hypothetical protein
MKRVMNFVTGTPSYCELTGDLKMVLWAGDCYNNGITDVERLANFDVYLCYGFIQTLQANIDYMNSREKPGIICILDAMNKEQMARFVDVFRGRFSVIDSDYRGNTPTLPRDYYDMLLSDEGKAFNVRGINGCILPTEDYQNTLELFAPLLSQTDNYRRVWTREFIELADGNKLTPGSAWQSPDLKHPYYDGVRERQLQLIDWNKNRNPVKDQIWKYSKDNIEEYWKLLPLHIITVNFERSNIYGNEFREYATMNLERFKVFLIDMIMPYIQNKVEFLEFAETQHIKDLQEIFRLCKEYPGIQFGYIDDNRSGKREYAHWITSVKNSAL